MSTDLTPAADAPLNLSPPAIHVSAEDGLDTAKYRRARAFAAETGAALVFDPPAEIPWTPPEGAIVLNSDVSVAGYRAAKLRAEAAGVPLVVRP